MRTGFQRKKVARIFLSTLPLSERAQTVSVYIIVYVLKISRLDLDSCVARAVVAVTVVVVVVSSTPQHSA